MEGYFEFTRQNLSDTEKIRLTALFLKDAARLWYKGTDRDLDDWSWDAFKHELASRFEMHNAVNYYADLLNSLVQLPNTPMEEHDQKFEDLLLRLGGAGLKLSDDEAFQRYRQSLNNYYLAELAKSTNTKTYRAAFELLEALPRPRPNATLLPGLPAVETRNAWPPLPIRVAERRLARRARVGLWRPAFPGDTARVPRREPRFQGPREIGRRNPQTSPFTYRPNEAFRPLPAAAPSTTTTTSNVKCFRCKRTGHYAKDCPRASPVTPPYSPM
jgi:hypothetical protein